MNVRRRAATVRHQSRLARDAASRGFVGPATGQVATNASQRTRHPGAPVLDPTPTRRTAHHEVSGARVTGRVESPHPADTLPADVAADLVAGKLEQICPTCGLREAAGGYCTADGTPTGPADWRRGTSRQAQGEASRARAHAEPEMGATALETANPEPLGLWPA